MGTFASTSHTPTPLTCTRCTVSGTDYNSGGEIYVNNFAITIPKNLIVQLPVVWAPFPKLCDAGATGFETTVVGNIVNGKAIAGQVQVAARFGLEGSQGYISAINPDGTLQISGGPMVRINDPDGLFGPKVETQPYFVADTGSPSVTSFSGFPMCVQHSGNTATCLSSNRPGSRTFDAPDPLRMVPFQVGDFIEYSGLRVGGSEILASVVTCLNVQVTTKASATVPNYIRVEEALVGVPATAANVDVAGVRFIGFLSSCAGATVTISAIDVDPCTGKETYRKIGDAIPKQGVACKWEARLPTNGLAPYTREYLITTNTPTVSTKDKIKAGQYVQAVSEWVFPELSVPGTNPPALQFTDIRGLVQGDFLDGQQFGPLSPFPGSAPPAPSKQCTAADIPATQPTTDQPTTNQPTTNQPTTNQPTTNPPTTSQPTTNQPATNPVAPDTVTMDSYTFTSSGGGTIAVTCSSSVKNGNNKAMTLVLNGSTNLPMTKNGEGRWVYNARSTKRPNALKCVSDLKGESASRSGATRRKRSVL
jgi:hypothetical protein